MALTKVTVDDLKGRLDRHEPLLLLDVRSAREWEESDVKLPQAMHVPPNEVGKHLNELPRDRPIITYSCEPHDESSTLVAQELAGKGFENVHPLYEGFNGWTKAGYPVEQK